MGGKLNVYNLGEKGVNVTKTPLHHEDGELLSAQNAEFYAEAGLGGLHKRPGLQRFNTSGMTNPVKGVIGVPLPGPGERAVHAFTGTATNIFKVTRDGTTWADAEGFATDTNQVTWGGETAHPKMVELLGQFFWAGRAEGFNPSGIPAIFGYDGEMEYELARFDTDSLLPVMLGSHNGKLIVTESALAGAEDRVWLIDPLTGEKDAIGLPSVLTTASAGRVTAACSFLGKVWIGCTGVGTFIFYAREGELNWTQDHTEATMLSVRSMLPYQGKLYVGFGAANPTASLLLSRDSAGTWATEQTAAAIGAISNHWDSLVIHQDKLYVIFSAVGTVGVDPNYTKVWQNDAGAWSISKDFSGTEAGSWQVRSLLSVASTLFASVVDDTITLTPNGVWKKVGAGAWTQSYSGGGGGGAISVVDGGMMGVV